MSTVGKKHKRVRKNYTCCTSKIIDFALRIDFFPISAKYMFKYLYSFYWFLIYSITLIKILVDRVTMCFWSFWEYFSQRKLINLCSVYADLPVCTWVYLMYLSVPSCINRVFKCHVLYFLMCGGRRLIESKSRKLQFSSKSRFIFNSVSSY